MNFNKHLLSAQYIRSLGMKRASIRERRAIIHLLYTILRHKFKQQRIGKSLDDQQCRQLLWGHATFLDSPHSLCRPTRLCSSVHPPSIQTSRMKMPKCYPSPRESTQLAATKHSDTRGAGAGSRGMRAVLALAEVDAGATLVSQNSTRSARASLRRRFRCRPSAEGRNSLIQRKPLWI